MLNIINKKININLKVKQDSSITDNFIITSTNLIGFF